MNVTINGHRVVREPSTALVQAALQLLTPSDEDLLLSLRDRIAHFETLAKDHPQIDIPVKHKFIDGLYRREVTFPKDFVGSGKVHLVPHMDEMLTGEMLVATPTGVKHLKAPCSLVTVPGVKKFGIALEETTWVTFHPTSCTTVEAVEAEIMCDDWSDYELTTVFEDMTAVVEARADFNKMLVELGVTAEHVRRQSECRTDCVGYIDRALELESSPIEGRGIFAGRAIEAGEEFLARTTDGMRAMPGRYTNHSGAPNAEMSATEGGAIMLVALVDIQRGAELTCDYRTSVSVAKELACQE